jgi:predicted phosphodiesterase/biotin operon repressor
MAKKCKTKLRRKKTEKVLDCASCPTAKKKDFDPANSLIRADVLGMISRKRRKGVHITELAKKTGLTERNVKKVISHLKHHGCYNIIHKGDGVYELAKAIPPIEHLSIKKLRGEEIKFGIVSDTHLCNKFARKDVLEAAYDEFKAQGVKEVFHAGNIIDGECRFNRYEIVAHGAHDQTAYLADHYPQRAGITTYFITGDCHEGWFTRDTGIRIGWYMEKWCEEMGRKDMKHIGHLEQDVLFERPHGQLRMRIMHPGGGTPYATSYPSQKMVESFQGGDKPQVLILGHYHKFDWTYPREVATIMAGSTCDQTSFMRKQKISSHVGFSVCSMGIREDGSLGRFAVAWHPFYDAAYHRKLDYKNVVIK